MNKHLVDVYMGNCARLEEVDSAVGRQAVFRNLEWYHAYDQAVPWDAWFSERPQELLQVLGILQNDSSYHLGSEHLLAGMHHWNEDLLLSLNHLSCLQAYGAQVSQATWHALGKRENGNVLNRLVNAMELATGYRWERSVSASSSNAAAMGFYTGSIEKAVLDFRSGGSCESLAHWCSRASKQFDHGTWTMFFEQYPDCAAFFVCHALAHRLDNEQMEFIKQWAQGHPLEQKMVHAFSQTVPSPYAHQAASVFSMETKARVQDKVLLISNLFPDVREPAAFLRMYASMFGASSESQSTPLPQGLEP